MRQVLTEDTEYPYLKPNARARLAAARNIARASGMTERSLVCLGGYTWCLFPWLGTRSFRTLRKYISANSARYGITGLEFDGCCYMTFRMDKATDRELISGLSDRIAREGIDTAALVASGEVPLFEKYDSLLPASLLRRQYAADRLRTDEAVKRLAEIAWELGKQ